ncbi:MAG: PBP1A family penicillin-binding protein [Ignavibacteriaceae bacterium]|nr:PBP1A family penicillin-binding protein [Ignavibacteriaceae bacterium]
MGKMNEDFDYKKYFNDIAARKKKKKGGDNNKRKKIIYYSLAAVILGLFIYIFLGLPSLEQLENPKQQLASKVYTIDGELLGQFYIENRIETRLDSLPKHLINALIATEDRRFYNHWGVDLGRFVKAMIKNVFTFSHEGASTITQQLARNLYQLKSGRENVFDTGIRKIREWITAIQIEKTYTKNEILELYFNVSYFGKSAYGVETAAKVYFNKRASELTVSESALLIALLKSSEYYDPVRHKDNALRRRNLVINNMVVAGYLSEAQSNDFKQQPITLAPGKLSGSKSEAPHFMEYVRQQMEAMADKYGYDLYRDGLSIYTTIDMRMQKIADQAAAEHLKEYQELFNKLWDWNKNKDLLASFIDKAIRNTNEYREAPDELHRIKIYNMLKNHKAFIDSVKKAETTIEVGFVCIDPSNGQIRAMVGGQNQDFGRGLNHVTGIRRQPGSSFKPFTYITAIDNGYFPAYTLLNQKFNYKGWSPDNAGVDYGGYMTLREALANSVNVIAGRMTISDIAPPYQVARVAKKMGINSPLQAYPSIALGTSEVSPLELTSAFATIDNNGVHISPISILKIENRNGIMIDQFAPEYSEAISSQTASVITDMLQGVVNYGTGAGLRKWFHRPAAGKTGTTQNFSDAWFVGYTPQLVAGCWVGFDDHRVKFTNWYGQGAKAAGPIWAKFMEGVYKELDLPLKYFELAPGVVSAEFCKESMDRGDTKIASSGCPTVVTDIISEKNMPGICDIHGGGTGKIKRDDKKGDTGW